MGDIAATRIGGRGFGRKTRWLATAALCIAVTATPVSVQAQSKTSRQATAIFNIPAQDLGSALTLFSDRAGLRLLLPSSVVGGKRSASVSGTLTREQALERLLGGTGLTYRFPDANTVTIVDPLATSSAGVDDGSTVLETISVDGAANGTAGIVATRSSSGTKTDTPLLEVPQTVNVVTRKEMTDRGVTDLNAAVAYTPGIRAKDHPGVQGMADVVIRGFYDVNASFYRDGLRSSFNRYDMDVEPFAFERMDILKGPSSVLYGKIQPGGLVNMTSKRPTDIATHEIQAEYGSHDRKQVAIDAGGPLLEDGTLLYRMVGIWRDSDTQVSDSPDDALYIAPALTWAPTDATSFTILGSYQKRENGGGEQEFPLLGTVIDNDIRIPSSLNLGVPGQNYYKAENTSIGYELKHEFDSGWKLSQNARFTYNDLDFVPSFSYDFPSEFFGGRYIRVMSQKNPRTSYDFLIDTNISGTADVGVLENNIVLGVDYSYAVEKDMRTNSTNFISLDVLKPSYGGFEFLYGGLPNAQTKTRLNQLGVYAQDQMKWESWVLTIGGRYDWANSAAESYESRTVWGGVDTMEKTRDRAFTGRVGLGYLFDNGIAPYVSYATSFDPTTGTDFAGQPNDPKTGEQWEAGVKYQPTEWNGFFSASIYQITQQNVLTADPLHFGYSVQQGGVRSRGFELEAKTELNDGLSLTAGYAYTDARVTEDNPNASGLSKVGLRSEAVPYHQASVWLDYAFQEEKLEGLRVGGGVRYVSSSRGVPDSATAVQSKVPGYALLDASVSYDFGVKNADLKGLSLLVSGTNLTDERYFTPGYTTGGVFFGNRRAVNATLSYKW